MDELELYDIYDIWHIPFWQTTVWYVISGIVLCSSLAFLFVLLIQYVVQRKRNKPIWEQVIADIATLEQQPCTTVHEVKSIYFSLTALLKNYIVCRYAGAHLSNTDREFLQKLKDIPLSHEAYTILHDIFSTSVAIKFARMPAAHEQIKHNLVQSRLLIYKTMPLKNK